MSSKRIGILTGGGDVPGLNQAIKGVVYRASELDHQVVGLRRGWEGLTHLNLDDEASKARYVKPLDRDNTRTVDRTGGTFLHSSRTNPSKMKKVPDFLNAADYPTLENTKRGVTSTVFDVTEHVKRNLSALKLDYLIAIGGDDTLSYAARLDKEGFPVVCIPKTMDNDVRNTEYCIGFSTAITRATDALDRQRSTVGSHERVGIFRVFGRDAGYTSLFTAYVQNIRCCIPEFDVNLDRLIELLMEDKKENPSNYSLVVLSEGAKWEGYKVKEYGEPDAYGHRKKMSVAEDLSTEVMARTKEETVVSDLTYELRSGAPDFTDSMVGATFGNMAMDTIVAGKSGLMTAIAGGCYTMAEIPDPALGPRSVELDTDVRYEALSPELFEQGRHSDLPDPRLRALGADSQLDDENPRFPETPRRSNPLDNRDSPRPKRAREYLYVPHPKLPHSRLGVPDRRCARPCVGRHFGGIQHAQVLLDQLPLHFEANQGQLDPRVQFRAQSFEHTVFLAGNEAVLRVATGALSISLKGGAPAPGVEGLDELRSSSSYFTGSDPAQWRQHVRHYGKVRYEGVYPGIDLIYYGKGRRLEHDFVVAPAADPSAIAIEFGGAESMEIGSSGELLFDVGGTGLQFSAPYAYVEATNGERRQVAARYVKTGEREVAFEVGRYDRSQTLVIDPVLSYSTFFGGSVVESARAVAIDAAGYVYVTGIRSSPDYPTNGVGLQTGGGGQDDVFLIKLDPFAGGLLYSSFFGGSFDEGPSAMELDDQGNIYIVGSTFSANFPATENAAQRTRQEPKTDRGLHYIRRRRLSGPLQSRSRRAAAEVRHLYLGRHQGRRIRTRDRQQRPRLRGGVLRLLQRLSGQSEYFPGHDARYGRRIHHGA